MSFFIASSPHAHSRRSTPDLMKWVALCAILAWQRKLTTLVGAH